MNEGFVGGLALSRAFYTDVVSPLLGEALGGAPYSAALLGPGSEVQGFDTDRSTDHAWGPRVIVFLDDDTAVRRSAELDLWLDRRLPETFGRRAVRFVVPDGAAPRHQVQLTSVDEYFRDQLGELPDDGLSLSAWLTVPTQVLRELTGGQVFHDGLGTLTRYRDALHWYPDDVWRYVLACQWQRLSQEEPLVGRCGEVGDDLGSAVVTARLVRDLMRLCLLMDRIYPPYGKWLGSAFAATAGADALTPPLAAALAAGSWTDRERHLARSYEIVAELYNARGLTAPLDPQVRPFHSRPFRVLDASRFADALVNSIIDPDVASLPRVGAVDQFVDSTEITDRHATTLRRQYVNGPPTTR